VKALRVPRISANEDVVQVAAVEKEPNARCAPGDPLCVLESTKATFVLEAEEEGHVYLTVRRGDRVAFDQVLGWIGPAPLDPATFPREEAGPEARNGEGLVVTKKAAQLLAKHGLRAEEVKPRGVLKASEVEAFLAGRTRAPEAVPLYPELERVMKSLDSDGAGPAEVEALKRTLAWAWEVYGKRWDRRVPVLDVLFDRWASAQAMGFGEGSNISHLSYVFGDVKVGKNTFVGPFTVLDGSGGLTIGDHCSIAAGVHLYSHDTIARSLSGHRAKLVRAPTSIGNACFLGPHSVVGKGVTIGDCCFVAANTLVTSDVPSHTAVQGNPARVIGRVEVSGDGEVRIVPVRRTE
jgi:acetyltransferase-like isoleucine patch superfamily enzyme